MVKLTYESGHIVLRNMDGTLHWNSHIADMKGCYTDEPDEGGYKEIFIEGNLIEKHDYYPEDKIIAL